MHCDTAAESLGYYDPNCETNHTQADAIMEQHSAYILSKAVTQFFNPDDFRVNKIMGYTSQVVNYFKYKQTNWVRYITYNVEQT